MKTKLILTLMIILSSALYGQSVQHPWWVLDGGGGKSAGGSYQLSASVGQPAVQKMVDADTGMILESGFLPGVRFLAGNYLSVTLSMQGTWNLISVPLKSDDMRKIALFPGASTDAYFFEPGGYASKDTLQNGLAYWIKYAASQDETINGPAVLEDSIIVLTGWNMIGSVSFPILASSIVAVPPAVITSKFFAFDPATGYFEEDTLKPGVGYWAKIDPAGPYGTLVIRTSGIVPRTVPKTVDNRTQSLTDAEFSAILVKDNGGKERKLFVGSPSMQIDLNKYELPPPPPSEILDVRFASQRDHEVIKDSKHEFPIKINGGEFPMEFGWNKTIEGAVLQVKYSGEKPKEYPLVGSGSVTINEGNFVSAKLIVTQAGKIELPKEFGLHQNYPNPFNPATHIRYDLPNDVRVSLIVYNIIGQEVATLVDEVQEAGYYSVEWDTQENISAVGSGVYFYTLKAGDFVMTKKLVLLR